MACPASRRYLEAALWGGRGAWAACPAALSSLRAVHWHRLPPDHHTLVSTPLPPCPPPPCAQLSEVVLVELAGGAVRHAPTARVMLEQVAPAARLTVLEAEWAPDAAPLP